MSRFDFYQQFLLTRKCGVTPRGFQTLEMFGWTLAAHPDLAICSLVNGREITGWIVGGAIDGRASLTLQIDIAGQTIESLIDRLAGRYAIVVVGGPAPRLYTCWCDLGRHL